MTSRRGSFGRRERRCVGVSRENVVGLTTLLKNQNNSFNFDLRAFVIKKFSNSGVSEIDNINIDSFSMETEYFSHRRAKKLGENDYGRCISVIKKII